MPVRALSPIPPFRSEREGGPAKITPGGGVEKKRLGVFRNLARTCANLKCGSDTLEMAEAVTQHSDGSFEIPSEEGVFTPFEGVLPWRNFGLQKKVHFEAPIN